MNSMKLPTADPRLPIGCEFRVESNGGAVRIDGFGVLPKNGVARLIKTAAANDEHGDIWKMKRLWFGHFWL